MGVWGDSMLVKKAGKVVIGAKLTSDEQRALDIEIKKAAAEMGRKHADEIDAILLWYLREKLGFGYERLKAFHHDFASEFFALCDRYEMEEEDERIWLCSKKLKDYDPRIDIHVWNEEMMKEVENARKNSQKSN